MTGFPGFPATAQPLGDVELTEDNLRELLEAHPGMNTLVVSHRFKFAALKLCQPSLSVTDEGVASEPDPPLFALDLDIRTDMNSWCLERRP